MRRGPVRHHPPLLSRSRFGVSHYGRGGTDASATVLIVPHHGPILLLRSPARQRDQHALDRPRDYPGHRAFLDLLTATSVGDVTAPAVRRLGALQRLRDRSAEFRSGGRPGTSGTTRTRWCQTALAMTAATLLPLGCRFLAMGRRSGAAESSPTTAPAPSPVATRPLRPAGCRTNLLPHACGAAACAVKPTKATCTRTAIPQGTPMTTSHSGPASSLASIRVPQLDWSDPTAIRYARSRIGLKAKTASGER